MVLLPFSMAPMASGLNVHAEDKNKDEVLKTKQEELEEKLENMKLKRSGQISQTLASWYGGRFHGKVTANNEAFNKDMLCAAHKTLPLNTLVLVTNLENQESVIVRVNDRGPFVAGRDLDISEAAAKAIGSYHRGVVPVSYEILISEAE